MKVIFQLAESKRTQIIVSVVLAALSSILLIVPYALIYYIVQYYLQEGEGAVAEPVVGIVGWALFAILLHYVLRVSAFVFSHIAAFDLLYHIRSRLAGHLGKLPMGYWNRKNSGAVRKVIQEDVEAIENFIAHHVPDFVSGLVLPAVTLVFLYVVEWRLALAATVPLPLGLGLVYVSMGGFGLVGKRSEIMERYHTALEEMHSRTVEYVQGMPVIKVFNLTVDSFNRLRDSVALYGMLVTRWSKIMTPFWAGFTSIVLGGGVFIFPVAVFLLQQGEVDIPTIILFLLLGTGCLVGLVSFVTMASKVMMIAEGAKRIQDMLQEEPLAEPDTSARPSGYDIEVDDVSFRYSSGAAPVLRDIDFDVPEGKFVALVGPSGAGKTTLVHLLARMWDVSDGEIRIGGKSLAELGSRGVNDAVGMVFQDVQMLTATVRENICMGRQDVSQEALEKVARAAACHDFIEALPRGYDTVIGEGGEVHLSGGEKQRIALARVILKNPPIVLLDEATSYADAENESRMQQAFSSLMQGRTVIVIAHRLSTIMYADEIIVMDKGRIVQRGTHDQLVCDEHEVYFRMWNARRKAHDWRFQETEKEMRGV
ncbi:ABC transporter ATP-binding protein [Prosthecochloris sp. SCSIO W1103]|uniref:ABC transporter ATP-binding protein n=1 Tax=Prosthecochloris sp. SCSIO W1103 TaxID=2992244 RepID=UPI00223D343B|nr:ABC transporter ATP-binding protein [Prosthecochloris sp. SCSIO W1103]UZJ36933.1 ABC transporter ATP-binding protein/permease [Prosthecochloris sp. SCSIO W1103]